MAFDPTLPIENTLADAVQMRAQFNGLFDLIPTDAVSTSQLNTAIGETARNPGSVTTLGIGISDPPTQFQVQAILDKLNELIIALGRTV